MIIDKIENGYKYGGLHQKLNRALEYLSTADLSLYGPGKYTIDGDDIYMLVNEYETKPADKCLLESHQLYYDMHYVIKGSETAGYEPHIDQTVIKEYDESNDYSLFQPTKPLYFKLSAGMFAVFSPGELHMPGIMDGNPEFIRKIVIKFLA